MTTLRTSLYFAVFSIAFLPADANAHHSFASTFDVAVMAELEGEVTSVRWKNPHVLFTLKTTDVDGNEVIYKIESHSLSIMRRTGIPSDALQVGDKIKVAGHPARRDPNSMFVQHALLPSGQEILFNPSSQPRWGENIGSNEIWRATLDDAQDGKTGIFRVWSTSFENLALAFPFPETMNPSYVENYPLTDSAKVAVAAFNPDTDIPTLNCAPKGMPVAMEQPYPMEISEVDGNVQIHLEEYDIVRTVHMTEAEADTAPSRLGYSTGRWDGSTLVVDTHSVNYGHFDTVGVPMSTAATMTERFIPSDDGKTLSYKLAVTDPSTFTEPVHLSKRWLAIPGAEVRPYDCDE